MSPVSKELDITVCTLVCTCFLVTVTQRKSSKIKLPVDREEEPELPKVQVKRVGLNDFTFLQVLGKGSFGKVRQMDR